MNESFVMKSIRSVIGALPNVRLFRNNVGTGFQGIERARHRGSVVIDHPRRIKFGLVEGSSDLIGFKSIEITPDMVGRKVAVFVAIEVKRPGGKPTKKQTNFINTVSDMGGIAGCVDDVEKAVRLVEG